MGGWRDVFFLVASLVSEEQEVMGVFPYRLVPTTVA